MVLFFNRFVCNTNDNEWNGFTGGSAQYAETYTENTTGANANSIFYVKSGSPYEPTIHYSNVSDPYVNGFSDGIQVKTGLSGESCLSLRLFGNNNNEAMAMRTTSDNDSTNIKVYEALASDTTYYEIYQDETQYRNKQLVYDLIDKSEINTTQSLQNFYSQQQNSSFADIASVNNAIANRDYGTAQSQNNSFTANNVIEQYQKRVNELLLKYLQYKPQVVVEDTLIIPVFSNNQVFNATELDELSNIANSCLDKYGNVITQARVILNNTLNRVIDYEDNCNPEYNQRKGKEEKTNITSSIVTKLYPNPNNGKMILEYDLNNNTKGEMQLLDITGKLINNYQLHNKTGVLQIDEEQLKNGIYFYRILVRDKIIYTNKIVIIK